MSEFDFSANINDLCVSVRNAEEGAFEPKFEPGIYGIFHKSGDGIYIGASSNVRNRVWLHFSSLKRGDHVSKDLQSDFYKYGQDAFFCRQIGVYELDQLHRIEAHIVGALSAPWRVYNSKRGGDMSFTKIDIAVRVNLSMKISEREKLRTLGGSKWLQWALQNSDKF